MLRAKLINIEEGDAFELLGEVYEVTAVSEVNDKRTVLYLTDMQEEPHELKVTVPYFDHEIKIEEYHHD